MRALQLPARALQGWSRWLCADALGAPRGWRGRWAELSLPLGSGARATHSMLVGFGVVDLGMHLLPSLALLQRAAPHVTARSVGGAYLATRLWSLAVTRHHVELDWRALDDVWVLSSRGVRYG